MSFFHLPFFKRALVLGAVAATINGAVPIASAAPRGGAGAARGASYVLGAGDAIRVTVKDFPEFNVENVEIPPDGVVSLNFYGTVRVGGRTASQVQNQLRSILLRELKQPRLSVTITKFRDLDIGRVYLAGSVPGAGPINIRENFRLSQLISVAGGLGGRLEEKSAILTRAGQKPIRVDLARAISQPNSAANVRLRPDDVLTVASITPGLVRVAGDVLRPDTFEMHRFPQIAQRELGLAPRLSDAILLAGGLARPAAAGGGGAAAGDAEGGNSGSNGASGASNGATSSDVSNPGIVGKVRFTGFLQRGGQRTNLNVEEALRDVGGTYNIPLRAGDFITVDAVLPPPPIPPIKVFVSGFVGNPGALPVQPGTRLLQAISQAGGLTRTPDKIEASVRREAQLIPINLREALLKADSPANIQLKAGDEVVIGEPAIIRVRVSGSVAKPGDLRLEPGSNLFDALTEAGNPSVKAEDTQVSVLRSEEDGSQKIISVKDPAALLQARSVAENIVLRDGDTVVVSPIQMQTVYVQGEVNNPGAIDVREGAGLLQVLTRAGGTKEGAALTRIVIDRNKQNISVDALDAIKLGKPLDFQMEPGDRVVVAPNEAKIAVLEAVKSPGVYAIPERGRLTISDALILAGGPSQSTKEIVLVRKVNGALRETKFPIKDVRSGAAGQQVLRAGDTLYVPATVAKRGFLEKIGGALGVLRFVIP